MAKYEDYVKKQGSQLSDEIDEAARRAQERDADEGVPERFKGKSKAEIAKAWEEADRALARQGNELGSLRKSVEDLSTELRQSREAPRPEKTPVTLDDIYDNADGTLRRVIKEESDSRIEALEKDLQQTRLALQVADARRTFEAAHPDYKEVIGDPEFMEWVKASTVRTQLAVVADQGNFDAANELFSTYKALKEAKVQRSAPRSTDARKVSLERSGGATPAPEKTFSRSELQEKRIAAQRGDVQASRWLTAHDADIRAAYAEGRLVT